MRLLGYDYSSPGYYFITICTKKMQMMFGVVRNDTMILNSYGRIIERCWKDLPDHYRCVLDAFVIMPNHIHGIIIIPDVASDPVPAGLNPLVREERETHLRKEKRVSITEIVRGFKTFSAATVNQQRETQGEVLWMRSFHDHIIRTVDDVERAREYIRLNPSKWKKDSKNPHRTVY